jgi:hypothetical protein
MRFSCSENHPTFWMAADRSSLTDAQAHINLNKKVSNNVDINT